MIGFTARSSQWYLTINVGIGTRKNNVISKLYAELWEEYLGGCLRIGKVKIWGII